MFRPPSLLAPQIVPTAANAPAGQPGLLRPSRTRFVTSPRIGYANRPMTGNWRYGDLHPARLRPCRLLLSRSPPIITDGQISRVRFETLAFFRRPSQVWRGFKRWSVYIPAILVCLQPRLLTVVALRRFYQAGRHTAEVAAKCPEPLCPTSVLPLLGRCECHLLRGRYPSVIAPTGSCATPIGLSPASAFSLVRRVLAGCTQSLLPPGASRRYL